MGKNIILPKLKRITIFMVFSGPKLKYINRLDDHSFHHLNTAVTENNNNTMKTSSLGTFLLVLLAFASLTQSCLAAGRLQACQPSGKIRGIKPPPGKCNQENGSDCCKQGQQYTTYKCSPGVMGETRAILTLNSFEKGGDGGGPSECDNHYHSDEKHVVALSTGWYSGGDRCLNFIKISANGRTVTAMVVDECDSTMGCDDEHDYQPPCRNNIVDASKSVWEALGLDQNEGQHQITWTDA